MDAAHFILEPFICALWCVARLFIKASSGRNRINVPGAVDAITKRVITRSNTTFINTETILSKSKCGNLSQMKYISPKWLKFVT